MARDCQLQTRLNNIINHIHDIERHTYDTWVELQGINTSLVWIKVDIADIRGEEET